MFKPDIDEPKLEVVGFSLSLQFVWNCICQHVLCYM